MSTVDLPFIQGKRARWAVLLLISSLPLLGWWTYGLFDLDEGFYASVTGSMIRHHEWITPLYNGKPWFEKPILIYWFAKPCVMLFGQNFGPRFPSVVATIATYALVAWFVRRRIGAMTAAMSVLILGSSILVVAIGRMIMTDAPLLFFFTAAMLTYWESIVGDSRWKLVTAACLGFAVLAKGPVAIILFVLTAGWQWFSNRGNSPHPVRDAHRPLPQGEVNGDRGSEIKLWCLGFLLLLGVISIWYVPAYLANGHMFVQEFLIKQNVGRFTGGDSAHTLPFLTSFWFYIPILLIGMVPWIFWLPAAWPRQDADPLKKYLAAWVAIIFIFFTISGAKLPHYILPCCPPIAILVAWHFADKWQALSRDEIRPKLMLTAAWLVMCWFIVQFGFQYWYKLSGQDEAHRFARAMYGQKSVVMFQLPRRDKALGTGKPKIQETSLPSMSFYINEDVTETDDWKKVAAMPPGAVIFTRVGRLPEVMGAPTRTLYLEKLGDYYEVFTLGK